MSVLRLFPNSGRFSERRPGSRWVSGGGYIYYWSDRPQEHLDRLAVPVADRLVPMYTEVNGRIMRLKITNTLDVSSLVSVYVPTVVRKFFVEEALYAQLQMMVDSCPKRDTLIVLFIMQLLILAEMDLIDVLVLTALDREKKALQCFFTPRKVGY